jgi:HAD superfamily hydrolase (TIGR01509 family)
MQESSATMVTQKQRIRALIFDFDGLILETERLDFQCWCEVYEQHGARLSLADWLPVVGSSGATNPFNPYEHLEAQLGRTIEREIVRTRRRQRYHDLVEQEPLLPGVLETIAQAQQYGLRLAVASSSSRDWVYGHLARRGLLERFDCVACGDEVAHTKPYPAVYQLALARLGVCPEQAIALEDSPNGVRAARAAGIFCVAVPGPLTRQCQFDYANMQLASLADLTLTALL